MYGGAKLKVWQVIVLGALWIALGIILDQAIDWDSPRVHDYGYYTVTYRRRGVHELFVALKMWLTGPVLIGLWHWFRAWEASRLGRAEPDDASATPELPTATPVRVSAPLPPPPRLGNDPFREPPAAPPIVVQRPPTAPVAAPIVASDDPDDKPKLLV